jgi:hypothetical protein
VARGCEGVKGRVREGELGEEGGMEGYRRYRARDKDSIHIYIYIYTIHYKSRRGGGDRGGRGRG